MAAGNIKLAPIPAVIHTARQELARLNEDASRFSIDAINRFKTIQLQIADVQRQLDVFGDFSGLANSGPTTIQPDAATLLGTSTMAAREDHQHAIVAAAPPVGIGAGNTEGVATSFARSDHNHTWRESGGPTNLSAGAVAAGEIFWRSGSTIIGRLLRVDRSAATNSTSSTSMSDVTPDLTVAGLTAGASYVVMWVVFYQTAAAGTGLLLSVNYTGTANNVRFGNITATGATTMQSAVATAFDTPVGNTTVGPGANNRVALLFCRMGATTAGDLALRYASGVAASSVTIAQNSYYVALQQSP